MEPLALLQLIVLLRKLPLQLVLQLGETVGLVLLVLKAVGHFLGGGREGGEGGGGRGREGGRGEGGGREGEGK